MTNTGETGRTEDGPLVLRMTFLIYPTERSNDTPRQRLDDVMRGVEKLLNLAGYTVGSHGYDVDTRRADPGGHPMTNTGETGEPTTVPPEPPDGCVVLDRDGQAWQRQGAYWHVAGPYQMKWPMLVQEHGPIRRLVPVDPGAEVIDALLGALGDEGFALPYMVRARDYLPDREALKAADAEADAANRRALRAALHRVGLA